ncbi:hypothetical protein PCANC_23440 [Puccinia coronata f. sp. avenae]|uniref:Uncharacterized protein n=1 Tax=Puccinia coronata f. sp. avenae TaxID=200324 RepID=A0A2N5TRF2_9BASI|nr:hypothetical protein PCANC_23440 [Puccinia coronata f. sp. avenae]PLW28018.1 hypothetical protein PCASD_19819 [Puccinia coronata f. sp. avenae]
MRIPIIYLGLLLPLVSAALRRSRRLAQLVNAQPSEPHADMPRVSQRRELSGYTPPVPSVSGESSAPDPLVVPHVAEEEEGQSSPNPWALYSDMTHGPGCNQDKALVSAHFDGECIKDGCKGRVSNQYYQSKCPLCQAYRPERTYAYIQTCLEHTGRWGHPTPST